jgi:hypothetical protein
MEIQALSAFVVCKLRHSDKIFAPLLQGAVLPVSYENLGTK